MPITALPSLDRTSATFKTDLDSYFLSALPAFSSEANALQTDVNAKQVTASAAAESAVIDAGTAASAAAAALATANAVRWVSGTTYALDVCAISPINSQTYRRKVAGAGTTDPSADPTNWAKAVDALPVQTGNSGKFLTTNGTAESWGDLTAGNHEVMTHTGNGHGSTNTKIRRFTTVLRNAGTAITYADSSTLGNSFTINENGVYAISYAEASPANVYFGISVNAPDITASIQGVSIANRLAISTVGSASTVASVSCVVRLYSGDVVRAHTHGAVNATYDECTFRVLKVNT